MSYQTLVVVAVSALFSFVVFSLLAAGVSALRRRDGGAPRRGRWARLRDSWRSRRAC
jgi:amino acid transporter